MPARRKQRRRRKASPLNQLSAMVTNAPIPLSQTRKFRWGSQISFDPAGSAATSILFNANFMSIPAPNTDASHQCLGHDQYAALYKSCRVVASKIKVSFTAGTQNAVCFIKRTNDATINVTPAYILEQPGVVRTTIGYNGVSNLSLGYDARKQWRGEYDLASQVASMDGTPPSDRTYFQVGGFQPAATGNLANIYCQVVIDYLVVLSDPKLVLQS